MYTHPREAARSGSTIAAKDHIEVRNSGACSIIFMKMRSPNCNIMKSECACVCRERQEKVGMFKDGIKYTKDTTCKYIVLDPKDTIKLIDKTYLPFVVLDFDQSLQQ